MEGHVVRAEGGGGRLWSRVNGLAGGSGSLEHSDIDDEPCSNCEELLSARRDGSRANTNHGLSGKKSQPATTQRPRPQQQQVQHVATPTKLHVRHTLERYQKTCACN